MKKKFSKKKKSSRSNDSSAAVSRQPISSVFKFSHHSIALAIRPATGSKARVVRGGPPSAGQSHGARVISVGELVFSDPSSRNSFRVETARELAKFLPQIVKTCDVLVFRAEGRVFCSGGNLKDHLAQGVAVSRAANREIAAALSLLSSLPIPSLAVVEGDALGGGVELLSAFDVVLAAPHVVLGFWQRRLGVTFGWGGGARLARRLGSAALVSRLALEARALTAGEALRVGLIDGVHAPWSLRREAMAEALRLASLPRASVTAMKSMRLVSSSEARVEQRAFEKLWFGPSHRAYLETRRR